MMSAVYRQEGGQIRVQANARQLAGISSPPAAAAVLHDAVVHTALALCNRKAIPREMEEPLSILLAAAYESGVGRQVSTVKRGDTSITYAAGGLDLWQRLLAPFVRMGTV